jgi:putative copper export protein
VTEALPLLAPLTRGSATLGLAFSLLLVAAVLARLYAQALALHGPGEALDWAAISAILNRTTWGAGWLLQAAATLVALAGFTVARHQSRGDARYLVDAGDSHPRTDAPPARAAAVPEGARGGTSSGGVATDVAEHEIAAQDERSGADGSGIGIGWALAALGVVVLAFTPALGGHAVATPDRTWLAVLSDGLHVLGAGGWLGSLLAVVAIGIPVAMHLGREGRGRAVAALVNAFSPTALFFAAIVTATGVLSASFHLGSFADLWQSDYGRTLLLKIGLLSLLFATGAYNWLRVRPALGSEDGARRLRRSASLELGVGVVVLLVTAVLVATPPPMDMERATDQPAVEAAS